MGTVYGLLSNDPKVVLYRHFDPYINACNRILFKGMKIVTCGKKEIIVLCEAYKKKLVQCGYKKVYVISNFASNNFKRQLFNKEQPLKAMIIGRYSKQKNQKFIVKALRARENAVPLDIFFYGDGDYKKIKSQANSIDRITFNGPVEAPYNLIDGNTIVISASQYEGLPIFILEALNAGSILICSDIPEHKYMLGESFYGYYESNNMNSFNQVLDKTIMDFSINHIRQGYLLINEEILGRFSKHNYSSQVSNFIHKRSGNE
jgi:glycosyltransferase involved in cell wall biosynthesis